MKLNPKWLRTFMVLTETRHFTETAQRLYMTQPGVSQHIKQLENHLSTPLFNRLGNQLEPTEAGKKLYVYAQEQQRQEEHFFHTLNKDDPYQGVCSIGCSGTLALELYPSLLELQIQHPKLNIHLEAAPNKKINAAILEGTLDLGIVSHQEQSSQLNYQSMFESELAVLLNKEYEDKKITWALLDELGFINHPDGDYYLKQIIEANFQPVLCSRNKRQGEELIQQAGYINQVNQILLPVAKGLGFTVLPKRLLHLGSYGDRVFAVKLSKPVYESFFLVHKNTHSLAARHHLIIATLFKNLNLNPEHSDNKPNFS